MVKAALEKTGEDYLTLRLAFVVHNGKNYAKDFEVSHSWESYTPGTNHTREHTSWQDALADTVMASTDAAKLVQKAEVLEAQAREIRLRIVGGEK